MERLLERPSDGSDVCARLALVEDEEELIRVFSDLDASAKFGTQWLVVTDKRIVLLPGDGRDGRVDVPVEEMTGACTEALVGAGCLEIDCRSRPSLRVPYSDTMAAKFSEVARGIQQISKGEPLLIKTELDRVRCEKCGRLLPEKNGICPACIHRLATLRRISDYLAPYKWRAVLMALTAIVFTLSDLVQPIITRSIIDDVLVPGEESMLTLEDRFEMLGWLVLGIVAIRLLHWAMEFLAGWIVSWLGAQMIADIRSQLYRRMELLSLQFYDKHQVGALMSRVTRDSDMLQDFLVEGLPYLVVNSLLTSGILGFLLWMNWQLTLYILMPVPPILLFSILFWRRMRVKFQKYGQRWSRLGGRLNEALSGIRVVKAFAQEKREIRSFEQRNDDLMEISAVTARNWFVLFATIGFLTGLGMVIVWFFGGKEVVGGTLTLGTLLAFYSYLWLLYHPLQWFGQVNSWMTRAFAGAERIFEVIDAPPETYEDPDAVPMPEIRGSVRFKDVTFGYDKSKPVLHDVDLDVTADEMIGLVGKSGVGKTTMINLICRFYDVDQGGIEIDGVDIRRIRLPDLRSQIGIVPQDAFLFSGTITENIGYGRPGAGFEEVVEAARAANAHEFIVTKPDGYDTLVGERGAALSGGERQRIALARAILHDPRILILDEATSSVDVQTEKRIQEAIARLVKGRTTFAIAHRLSTLRSADRLVVLEAGRIVETGSHEELMESRGVFHNLVQMQKEVSVIIGVKE